MRRAVLLLLIALVSTGCLQQALAPAPGAQVVTQFEAVRFETDAGEFVAILFEQEAPQTVAFFKKLVESGYYDGREFNRVIPGFVIQEVDRLGGATDQEETVKAEFGTRAMFSAGAIGIARNEDPDSGGSEFFVMDFAHSHLYGNYTAFAQVVEGLDVVHAIARVRTVSTHPGAGVPFPPAPVPVHDRVALVPVTIEKASLTTVTLEAADAARYPLVVGETIRTPGARATLEWPQRVAAGEAAAMTWYVYTSPDAAAPDLDPVDVRVRGPTYEETFLAQPHKMDPRILHWTWVPPARGVYNATLSNETGLLGWAHVAVP